MKRVVATMAVAGILLAGCGGGGSDAGGNEDTSTTEATTTTTESTTTTTSVEEALRRYASKLAPTFDGLDELGDDLVGCSLDAILEPGHPCTTTASIQYLTLELNMETILVTLDQLEEDVGIPSELEDLVADTRFYADQVLDGVQNIGDCTPGAASDDCSTKVGAINGPLGFLNRTIAEWSPYL